MPTQHLTTHLLEIALFRCKALERELSRIRIRQYPPTGPKKLIELVERANIQISKDISNLLSLPNLPPEPDRRIEIFLRDKTNLLSWLHASLYCVEGAEIQSCPGTFIVPIRRMLMRQLRRINVSNFDFIVKASYKYNYMIWSIHEEMNEVFTAARYPNIIQNFPEPFFIIECPMSEKRNIPIHCIFAHEVGHVWYQAASLSNRLLPLVQRTRDTRKQKVTKANWVEELTADAIALCLFGPAFLYSSIYFSGPFCTMSGASGSHPPDGVRIQFLCKMLLSSPRQGGLDFQKVLSNENLNYLQQWMDYSSNSIRVDLIGTDYWPILQSVRPVLIDIMKEAKRITNKNKYNTKIYGEDIFELCENIANGIPPNEIIIDFVTGKQKIVKPESILNAGWSFLISGDLRYSNLLRVEDKWKVTNRLFDLVSKGMEYSEMTTKWINKK